jgi:hypothetical protein
MTSVRTKVSLILTLLLLFLASSQIASAWYDPGVQRWINRDPIQEKGGINLYQFVSNRPADFVDLFGLKISSIERCNRAIENPSNDFGIGCANLLRGHDFFRWPSPGGGFGSVGFPGPGGSTLPVRDQPEKARSCRSCETTGSPILYGSGAGKSSDSASDAEIQDCLRNRPLKGKYGGFCNNCNDWANGAEKDCGLWCSGNSYLPAPGRLGPGKP